MSLRHKIILLLLGSFVCFAAVSWAIITDIVEAAFGRVERARIEQAQQRVQTNLRNQLNFTRTLALDWGHWTESYEFVQGRNDHFIDDNLVADAETGAAGQQLNLVRNNERRVETHAELTDQ